MKMEKIGCAPSVVNFNTLIREFCNLSEVSKVVELLVKMKERNISPDEDTVSLVLDILSKHPNSWKYISLIPNFSA